MNILIAVVDPRRCSRYLTCVLRVCQYEAQSVHINGNPSTRVDPAICQGCGARTAECPVKASDLRCFTDAQITAKVSTVTP